MAVNFQRRNKRIAGPGFHVNVKMDAMQIARMRGAGGRINNNTLIPASAQPEVYDVKEQELLVSLKNSSMFHDGYTHVFSAVNGYPLQGITNSAESVKAEILNDVQFVGIATTEQKSNDTGFMEQGLVAQVGGVTTILNNGSDTIYPTDKIMLDINLDPRTRRVTLDKGIPREKIRFSVRKAGDDIDLIKESWGKCKKNPDYPKNEAEKKRLENRLKTLRKRKQSLKAPTDNDEINKNDLERADIKRKLEKLQQCNISIEAPENLQKFLVAYRNLNQRVIGKAMSYARPGDRFEILLSLRSSL